MSKILSRRVHILDGVFIVRVGYSLRAGRSGDRIPVGDEISVPVQPDPGTHPFSYTMGTGSFAGVKQPGRGFAHPPHSAPRLKKE